MTANADLSDSHGSLGLRERVMHLSRLIHGAGGDAANIFSRCGCTKANGGISNIAQWFETHRLRLIGNTCRKSKDQQDKVSELDGIPLMLDSCSLEDSTLVLASGWCVLPETVWKTRARTRI